MSTLRNEFEQHFPRMWLVYVEGLQAGLHIGAQIYVRLKDALLADVGLGESRPGVAMTSDSLMLWLSSGKPLTALAALQQVERGALALDNRVAQYIPAFGENGKQAITIRQLLTHTGGFRFAVGLEQGLDWDEAIDRICRLKLERDWIPGETAGYHPLTSWYILAELVRRVDGRPFPQYLREEVLIPLGMHNSWIGMTAEAYQAYGTRIGLLQNTEKPGKPPAYYSTEAGATRCAPGGGAIGPIRELAQFYEGLFSGQKAGIHQILKPETLDAMTQRQRPAKFDLTFRATIDWGWGLICDSKRYGEWPIPYGYGRYASDATFGHSGSQSSTAFVDPLHGLYVALVFNGTPGELAHQPRIQQALEAIYLDLGLASE